MTAAEQLTAIEAKTHQLVEEQYHVYNRPCFQPCARTD